MASIGLYLAGGYGAPRKTPGAAGALVDGAVAGLYLHGFGALFAVMGGVLFVITMLRALLVRVARDYAPPAIYVTENGAAFDDPDPVNGVVEDPQRVDYYWRYLDACAAAIAQGVPLKGYFAWSLLDNFEWARGYLKRFGIVHVDYKTLVRTPKRSALFYRDLIAAHRADASD